LWGGVAAAVVGLAACDRPVPDAGPVTPGEIQTTRASALARPPLDPPTTDIVIDIVVDFKPPDCTTDGCPLTTDPCSTYVCNTATLACDLKATNEGGS